jgi:hypothetical protein
MHNVKEKYRLLKIVYERSWEVYLPSQLKSNTEWKFIKIGEKIINFMTNNEPGRPNKSPGFS